jgi:WD40 repeat protein
VAFDSTYLLASCSFDKTIKIWNKNTGGLMRTLTGHSEQVETIAFDSTNLLASGSWDGTIKLWRT